MSLPKIMATLGVIETRRNKMASSHQIKRFFGAFSFVRIYLFRRLLQTIFIWRLNVTKPTVIMLDIDTMVMANDDALKREGVEPTYKKKKGFQPLLLKWGTFVVDSVFRGGSKHSNYSDTVIKMLEHIVGLIRKKYREDVPIILKEDSWFYDQVNFKVFEELGIGYICVGKIYADIREYAGTCPGQQWVHIEKKNQEWGILEFGDCRKSWNKFRRAFYTRPLYEDNQKLLEFARPETVLYTNLGMGGRIDMLLKNAGLKNYIEAENIVGTAHLREADELVYRGIKDFGTEQLPFQRFESNTAFFYIMLTAFNLLEALLFLYYLSLMIYALIERDMQLAMRKEKIKSIPIYPEQRECRKPSAERILEILQNISMHELWENNSLEETFFVSLNSIQSKIQEFLKVSSKFYCK